MKRLRRWLLRLVIVAAAAIGAIAIGGKLYLATPQGGARIAARLSEVLGDRITIAGIDAGLTASTIRDVQLYETGPDAPAEPWVVVPSIRAELPLLDAVRGEMPRSLTLFDAAILLRFDRAGRLLTRFPDSAGPRRAVPPIRLERARVTLRQEGRADLDFGGINAVLRTIGDALQLTGTADDPVLGAWTIAGALDAAAESSLTLKTAAIHLTPTLLERMPFIPPAAWEQIQADGVTPLTLTIRFDAVTERVFYEAVLTPEQLTARVKALDLPLEQAHGRIIVADGVVQLHDLRGSTAGGTLTASGTLDFRNDANQLDLGVRLERIDLQRLPPRWTIPPWLEGQLKGQAALRIRIADRHVQFRGVGTGAIDAARLAGLPTTPIDLRLRDDTLEAEAAVQDADIGPVLRQFAVTTPATGRVNGQATLAIPLDTARDWTTYRLQGEAHLPWLQVAGVELVQVQTRVAAAGGLLHLADLQGVLSLEDASQAPVTGSAQMSVVAPYRFTGALNLPPATHALRLPSGAEARGSLQASGSVQGTLQPFVLQAVGTARGDELRLGDRDLGRLTSRWEADVDRLRLLDLRLTDGRATVTGTATVPLRSESDGNVSLAFTDFESAAVAAELPMLPVPVSGLATGTLEARWRERHIQSGALTLQAPRLRLGPLAATRAAGSATYQDGKLDYRFQSEALGGQASLEGQGANGRLRVQGARLSRARQLLAFPVGRQGLRGTLDLDLNYQPDGSDRTLGGNGRFVLSRLRWLDTVLAEQIRGEIVIAGDNLRVKNLNGSLAGGIVGGEIGWHLQPQRRWLRLNIQGVELQRLLAPWPDAADRTQGVLDLRLRANLGREWRGTADVSIQRGQLMGAELTEARIPIEISYAPDSGRGHLEVREGHAQLARGRVQGQVSLRFGAADETQLDGSLRFFGLQLHSLLRGLPDVSQRVDNGDLAGRLDFSANNLQSMDDLTATLDATLRNGQVLDLPVLRQLAPFIAPGRSLTAFSGGELRARLARGLVRVERLQLTGSMAQALIAGTVTRAGRLALDVTANPGLPGGDLPILRQLGLRLPSAGQIPVGVVNQASRLLTGRLVRLRIGGTVRSPIVQVVPLSILDGDMLRFFLGGAAR